MRLNNSEFFLIFKMKIKILICKTTLKPLKITGLREKKEYIKICLSLVLATLGIIKNIFLPIQ